MFVVTLLLLLYVILWCSYCSLSYMVMISMSLVGYIAVVSVYNYHLALLWLIVKGIDRGNTILHQFNIYCYPFQFTIQLVTSCTVILIVIYIHSPFLLHIVLMLYDYPLHCHPYSCIISLGSNVHYTILTSPAILLILYSWALSFSLCFAMSSDSVSILTSPAILSSARVSLCSLSVFCL